VRQKRADDVHDPGDVQVDLALPVVLLEVGDGRDQLNAGIVEQQIGGAQAGSAWYTTFAVASAPAQRLIAQPAEPGSRSAEALALLGTLAA
jgi:hypothetical protein